MYFSEISKRYETTPKRTDTDSSHGELMTDVIIAFLVFLSAGLIPVSVGVFAVHVCFPVGCYIHDLGPALN